MNSFWAGVVIDILKELLINITTRFVTQANASFLKGSPTAQFVLVIILRGFWQMLTNEILWDFPINMVTEFGIQIFTRVFMGKALLKKFWCAWSLSEYLF